MTFKDFMYKGVLMIAVLALIGWLGKYLYLVDGEIDWFRLMLVYGVPVGIPPYVFHGSLALGFIRNTWNDDVMCDCWKFIRQFYCNLVVSSGSGICDWVSY